MGSDPMEEILFLNFGFHNTTLSEDLQVPQRLEHDTAYPEIDRGCLMPGRERLVLDPWIAHTLILSHHFAELSN